MIFGKVTGLSPAEIATVRVHASGANGFNALRRFDPSGSYEIDGAPPGAVNVTGFVRSTESRSLTKAAEIAEDATWAEVDLDFLRREHAAPGP